MGLPLYNPLGSILYLSELEPGPEESGILARRLGGPTPSPKHRRPYQYFHQSNPPLARPLALGDYHPSVLKPASQPSHFDRSRNWPSYPLPKTPRTVDDLDVEAREGRDLARSNLSLPRRPSLEREEAFCGERPAKKRCLFEREISDETIELYHLGILYDNPHERGERFTFEAIVHDEPLYNINVRPTKRGRKHAAGRRPAEDSWRYGLPLDLSFAALEDDEHLARLLMAPDIEESTSPAELGYQTNARSLRLGLEDRLVRVVYELDEGLANEGRHNNAATAGTPTMTDSLSPSTSPSGTADTQARTTTQSLPASQEFPDLISDSKHDDTEEAEWEVLDGVERRSDGAASPEAWVVLG